MSILNTNMNLKFRTFLLCFVTPAALMTSAILAAFLDQESRAVSYQQELRARGEQIEMLQNDVEALQGLVDFLDLKQGRSNVREEALRSLVTHLETQLELSEIRKEATTIASEIVKVDERIADNKEAYARLYK